jgi:hypothetical protein
MAKETTAVEWLEKELKDRYPLMNSEPFFEQAKQVEKQNKIDFLVWLKENHWHVYKDGTWFTSKDHAYMNGKPRKFYTEEQVIQKYNAEMVNNVPYKVQNEAN